MGEFTTDRRVNVAQLADALGGIGVVGQGGVADQDSETTYRAEEVSNEELQAAIEALDYDPEYGLDEVQAAQVRLLAKAEQVLLGNAKFTPAERDEALASLLLAGRPPAL